MNRVVHGGDAELLRAAPGDGPHIGLFLVVAVEHLPLGGVDLGDRVGDLEVEDVGGALQPLGMLGSLVDGAAIGALALEHAAGVMQPVGQDADLAVGRRHELAVEPDQVRTLVEGHRHGISSKITNKRIHRGRNRICPDLRPLAAFASGLKSRYVRPRTIRARLPGRFNAERSNPFGRYDPFVRA